MLNYREWAETPMSIMKSIRASRAENRWLGRSGLVVSNPIMGGMHIGSSKWYEWVMDEEQGIALLKSAYDRGINTASSASESAWDTTNIYSNGGSERFMGKLSKVHNIPHSKIFIMTKCFRLVTYPDIDDIGSCTAFSLDLAWQSKDYETMKALYDLAKANMVRYLAASSM
ncbi:hypothetical protein SLS56_011837 [Neofusicoccum ribis]|uniref:NADP-dependent oxidoreductase domain-containing protein n=1 Tax=Neofusicoccum ribis TaxID=45134 RepID=A0ABR3SB62_9PEZI